MQASQHSRATIHPLHPDTQREVLVFGPASLDERLLILVHIGAMLAGAGILPAQLLAA